MFLTQPTLRYKQQYLDALEECSNETSETILNQPAENQSFEDFVQQLTDNAKGENLPEGYVPAVMYWLIDNNEVIGRVQIRLELNDYLLQYGGHIGYYIRPSKRNIGYGRKILELALEEAKNLGIEKVLITCNESNAGSRKIIVSNGGALENIVQSDDKTQRTMRYWITLVS